MADSKPAILGGTLLPDVLELSACVSVALGQNPSMFTGPGTNTYLVGRGKKRLLLDTGSGLEAYMPVLEEALARLGCDGLEGIVLTHAHPDHIGGVDQVRAHFGEMPVYKRPWPSEKGLAGPGGGVSPVSVAEPDRQAHCCLEAIDHGDVVETEGARLRAVYTPGHAPDHLCFVLEEEQNLFSGDNVLGVGTTVIPGGSGDLGDYMDSLERLRAEAPRQIYPAHGPRSNVATVSITVTAVNDAPTVVANRSPASGTAPLAVTFTAVGSDVDGDALTYSWVFGDGGTATAQNPSRTYTNAGTYTATVTVSDGKGGTASASLTTTVSAVLGWIEPFEAYAVGSQMHGQGGWKGWDNNSAAGALVAGTPVRAGSKSVAIAGASDLVHEFSGYTTGKWTFAAWQYVPTNFTGQTYSILLNKYADGGGAANKWASEVLFDGAAGKVHSNGDGAELALAKGRWVELRVAIDLDADTQSFHYDGQKLYQKSWSAGVSAGGVKAIAAVDLFANNASAVHYDDLSLQPQGGTPNRAPVAQAQSMTTAEDTAKAIVLTGTDADGDALTYAIVTQPVHGTLSGTAPGVTYTPVANYNGSDSFAFRVSDGKTNSAAATVSITVTAVNDAPTVVANRSPANGMAPLAVTFTAVGSDVDGDALTYSWVFGDGSTSSPQAAGTANHTYTNAGTYTATVTVSDGKGGTASASLTTTVSAKPVVRVAVYDGTAAEPADPGVFKVYVDQAPAAALTVKYAMGGTASNGADYAALTGSVAIPAGTTTVYVTVAPVNDALVEGTETVTLNLTADAAYALGNTNATLYLYDDEKPEVTIAASDSTACEVDEEAGVDPDYGKFTVKRYPVTTNALTVVYTVAGTATPGADYQELAGRVTIPGGKASATILLVPNDDVLVEGTETVTLTVGAGTGYAVGPANTAAVNVYDDEKPRASVTAVDPAARETGKDPGVFRLSRLPGSSAALMVKYGLSGTAVAGTDYETLPGWTTIPAGAASVDVTIMPKGNVIPSAKTVLMPVLSDSGYEVGSATAQVTIQP